MSLKEDVLNLFGLQIKKEEPKQELSGALAAGLDDDGAATTLSAMVNAGSFGTYLDTDGQVKTEIEAIRKYREISLFAEVDVAIQEIVNEAIPQEQTSKLIKLDIDELESVSDNIKDQIQTSFDDVVRLLEYDVKASEYFKRFYVDGRLPFQIIVDKNNLKSGIQRLVLLDAQNVKKIKEVTTKKTTEGANIIEKIDEYYLYNETGFGVSKSTNSGSLAPTLNLKISQDAIIFVSSGIVDNNTGMILSYLNKAIRPINQLRMLEDATVVYFIARAPERRVFYVDVGNLPKLKAEQYLKDIMNRYRNKMVYDAKTGDVKNDKKYMSMLEDFWMPRRDGGKGTEISTLAGAQNITGYLDSLEWFKEKMYESLNIPKSRLQQESGFTLGQSQTISRDEVKFQKFIDRLRNRFGQLLIEALKTQLILTQVCNSEEWEEIKPYIKLDFQKDNFFTELKNQEVWQSRFTMVQQIDDYLQKYVSKEWVQKNVLMMTDEDIKLEDQRMSKEKSDDSAQPNWKIQGQFQSEQQQEMMQQQMDAQGGSLEQQAPQGQPSEQSQDADPAYNPQNYMQQ